VAEHVHVHPPEELTEGPEEAHTRQERLFELAAVFLMSIATVAIAWSGYQATAWAGVQAAKYAESNTGHERATRIGTLGGQERLEDIEDFNRWLEATTKGDAVLSALYERRFRAEFRVAFAAWIAHDPLNTDRSPPSPLFVEEYQPAHEREATRLEHIAEVDYRAGVEATENTDDYVFITVLLAAVLFFAGISLRFRWSKMRIAVLGLATVFLAFGMFEVLRLPAH
jgi:hypothetical protein